MKKTWKIGTGIFGEGTPKICVPIVAKERKSIWKKAEELAALPQQIDVVEWRADFYEDVCAAEEVCQTLRGLKERLGVLTLLFTFRTSGEGGNRSLEKEEYYRLNRAAAASGYADLIDVEAFLDETRTASEIDQLHASGVKVIASNHDFAQTPLQEEMIRRLLRMEELGADAAKLAVMPQSRRDVTELLSATAAADERIEIPVVTMSMGELGLVSRISGGLTGSAMTFAAAGETSAPGQLSVERTATILKMIMK